MVGKVKLFSFRLKYNYSFVLKYNSYFYFSVSFYKQLIIIHTFKRSYINNTSKKKKKNLLVQANSKPFDSISLITITICIFIIVFSKNVLQDYQVVLQNYRSQIINIPFIYFIFNWRRTEILYNHSLVQSQQTLARHRSRVLV